MSDLVKIRKSDPVCKAIGKVSALLERLPHVDIRLGNGQIEKPLKFFVVSALATDDSVAGGYLSDADKRHQPPWRNTGPELDLLALATKAPGDAVYSCPDSGSSSITLYEHAVQDNGQAFDPIRIWDAPAIDAIVTRFEVRDGKIVKGSRHEFERVEVTSA